MLMLSTTVYGQTPRILLIGDSWADQMGSFNVVETVLASQGLSQFSVVKEGISGSTAAQWVGNHLGKLDAITTQLTNNPTIDIVHINLGGNDLIAVFPFATEQDRTDALESIADDIDFVVDYIHAIDPDIRVAICSYDYINVIEFNPIFAVNAIVNIAHTAAKERFEFINAVGIIHHIFGFDGQFAPGETPLPGGFPDYDPIVGGDPSLVGTPEYNDGGIHLNEAGYITYMERLFNEFYRPWLLEDQGGTEIWVDFAHRGDELGTTNTPINDLTNAVIMINPGETIKIKGDIADSTTPEILTIDKAMQIQAVNGAIRLGDPNPSPASFQSNSGFVSRNK
mgnify:CR=1 FL=1